MFHVLLTIMPLSGDLHDVSGSVPEAHSVLLNQINLWQFLWPLQNILLHAECDTFMNSAFLFILTEKSSKVQLEGEREREREDIKTQ